MEKVTFYISEGEKEMLDEWRKEKIENSAEYIERISDPVIKVTMKAYYKSMESADYSNLIQLYLNQKVAETRTRR